MYVRHVALLDLFSLGSLFRGPLFTSYKEGQIRRHEFLWRLRFLHHIFGPPRMHLYSDESSNYSGVSVNPAFCFISRFRAKDIDTNQVALVLDRTSDNHLTGRQKRLDILNMLLLHRRRIFTGIW